MRSSLFSCPTRSTRATRLLSGLVVVAGACAGSVEPPPGAGAELELKLGLRPVDALRSADASIDDSGCLTLAWVQVQAGENGRLPRYTLAASEGGAASPWSAPSELAAGVVGEPRLVQLPGGLRLVAGASLSLFARDAAGWRKLQALTPPGLRAEGADARAVGEQLLVCFVHRPSAPYAMSERGAAHRQRLVLVPVAADAPQAPLELADFEPSMHPGPAPRLVGDRDGLHLVVGLNLEREDARGARRVVGEVVHLSSADGGASWSDPSSVLSEPLQGGIAALDIVARGPHLQVYVSAHGIRRLRSGDGGATWGAPEELAPYDTSIARGTGESGAVRALLDGEEVVVAWIDARHREGNRSALNPLGGLPWSDDPAYQQNNDVFALRLPFPGEAAQGDRPVPVRLTAQGSFAHSLRVLATDESVLALWAGRGSVGDQLDSTGSEPAFFRAAIP